MAGKIEYNNPKSSKIRELIRINLLGGLLRKTKNAKDKVLDLGVRMGFLFQN